MSEGKRTMVTTPRAALSPDARQRQEVHAAEQRALQQSEAARQIEIANLRRQYQEREAALENSLRGLDEAVRSEAINHRRQMQEQSNHFYDRLDMQSRNFQEEIAQQAINFQEEINKQSDKSKENIERIERVIAQQSKQTEQRIQAVELQTQNAIRETNERISEVADKHQREIDRHQKEIDNIHIHIKEEDEKKKKIENKKRELLTTLKGTIKSVDNLQHEKYEPGKLIEIVNKAENLEEMEEAVSVCTIAHIVISELNNLAVRIENARKKYEVKHFDVITALEDVLIKMNENRKNHTPADSVLPIGQVDERGKIIQSELDFWSEGEYGELYDELTSLQQKVRDGEDDPVFSIAELDNILKRTKEIEVRQKEIFNESIEKGNASHMRVEMAEIIAEVLNIHGYEHIDSGYEMEDQRKGFIVKLRSEAQKSNLVVLIHPVNQTINISTQNEGHLNPAVNKQRADMINQSLRDAGLNVGDAQCTSQNEANVLINLYDDEAILKSRGRKEISNIALSTG